MPLLTLLLMQDAEHAAELKKKRAFRKFSYRGVDLEAYVLDGRVRDARSIADGSLTVTVS
jgi:hypothetical protein